MATNPTPAQIIKSLNKRFYSQPLLDNVYRGDYVETLILFALGDGWKAVGGWGSWDLEKGVDGVRVEVKQSAALQTWGQQYRKEGSKERPPSFDIAPRTGYHTDSTEDAKWVDLPDGESARFADIYIFAWHPERDTDTADHRRAGQWSFFVVPEHQLPSQKTISLNPLQKLAAAVTYDQLATKVTEVAAELPYLKAERLRR